MTALENHGNLGNSASDQADYDAESALRHEGYSNHDEERWANEPEKSRSRTEFERDRARIVHSSALRRLGAKTQVLVAGTDDFARTRLTHTLEVAQVGRQMAKMFGCDPDLVDCACLCHDLGHPPFGHNGEKALAHIAQEIGGFEGNAQTFRLLTRLEPKIFHPNGTSAGVNLTRATLDAATKYPWTREEGAHHPDGPRGNKFCVYPDDLPAFRWLKQGAPAWVKPMECQIMDLSDDIAYSVHDVEDAIVSGYFKPLALRDTRVVDEIIEVTRRWYGQRWDPDLLLDALNRLRAQKVFPEYFTGSRQSLASLKNMTSRLIGHFTGSAEKATRQQFDSGNLTRYSAHVVVPSDTWYEITLLKGISAYFVMEPREHEDFHQEQLTIVKDLVSLMMENSPTISEAMEPVFAEDWYRASTDGERLRVAIDQVASLTDGSALAMHSILC